MDVLPDDIPITQFYCGQAPSWWVQVLALVLYMYVERWLGRTKLVTAASVWDLIVHAIKRAFSRPPKPKL